MNKEYILFVFQDANFLPKFLLVPATEFIQVRNNEYQNLISIAHKNIYFDIDNNNYHVNNLIIEKIENGTSAKTNYSDFCQYLQLCTDGLCLDYHLDDKDKLWHKSSKFGTCQHADNVEAYIFQKQKLRKSKHKIINSFLVLQKNWYDDNVDQDNEEDLKYIN